MNMLWAAAALLTLAACSQSQAPTGGAETTAASAASAPAPAASSPASLGSDRPRQRPGLWRASTTMEGIGVQTVEVCITPEMANVGPSGAQEYGAGCTEPQVSRDGEAWVSRSICEQGGRRTEVATRMTGDLQNSMNSEVRMTADGQTTTISARATYVGPCPAGG